MYNITYIRKFYKEYNFSFYVCFIIIAITIINKIFVKVIIN